jgi:predicted ATPase/DNA-binding winged helix-turn-helix (wHTH) protein
VRDSFQTALALAERREDSYHKAQRRVAGSEPDDGAAGVATRRGGALWRRGSRAGTLRNEHCAAEPSAKSSRVELRAMSDGAVQRLSFGPFELRCDQRALLRDGEVLGLGGRALDLLIYLVSRPGEVIAKKELIDHVWSNVTVEEGSLRVHVAAIRKTLGDGQFGNRYIANVQGRGYSFVGSVIRLEAGAESIGDVHRRQRQLPVPPPRMIGRDQALGAVREKLLEDRFVTLLGPAGIGKTTLAVAVGNALVEAFNGEVYFVDLASLTDPNEVASAIGASLGLALKSKDTGLDVVDQIRSRRLLVILDSCEQVIEAVASIAEQFYQETAQVHLLTTSRELLRVEGERCYQVPVLDVPPNGLSQTADTLRRYPAAQLFMERVAARGVVLADDETPLVAEMCRRLDGLPLAIELVARQVAARGVRNTAACLVELLNFSDRTANPRHRTLKAALDWSYHLLSAPERIVFRRIVPFVGYFTLEGAQYVAGEFAAGRGEIFDAIAGLTEKSLIMTRLVQGQPQYRLLDTTRTYALEKLEEHAESDAIYLLHAQYTAEQLEMQSPAPAALPAAEGVAAYLAQLGNARAALEWSAGPDGNDGIAKRLAIAMAALDRKSDGIVSPVRQRARQILNVAQSGVKAVG